MKITLTTQTPVHIGTGQTYHPNEYILTQTKDGIQFFSRVNQTIFLKSLTNDQRDALSEDMLDDRFSLGDFFKTHSLKHVDFRRYRAENHTRKKDPAEIRECIKTADKPYIPGSSLKGAIRTALLWWHAKDDSRYFDTIRKDLENDHNGRKKRSIGDSYVAHLFNCSNSKSDPKYDLLRFLQISDCMSTDKKLSIESVQTSSLRGQSLAKKGYEIYAECVTGTFAGSIGGLDQIEHVIRHRDYPYLKDKISLLGMNGPTDIGAVPAHLNNVIAAWSRWCLEQEKKLVSLTGGEYEESLGNVSEWVNADSYIRLGFGIGTLYQTMIGLVEEHDPELAVDLINTYHLGKYDRAEGYGGVEPPYPKSIEFSNNDESFGWLRFHAE